MIEIPITRDMAHEAALMAEQIPASIKNSIRSGQNRFIGCLGEAALIQHLKEKGSQVVWNSTGDYDLTSNGKRLEVKTKKAQGKPLPEYECSVACFNSSQQCDFYVFARATNSHVYLLGYITPEELHRLGRHMKKGQPDTNLVNGKPFEIRADCINVRIDQLQAF